MRRALAGALTLLPMLLPAEVPPPRELPCFPGAYYRKAVSSHDEGWTGIEASVTLPRFHPDPERLRPNGRPVENSSLYIGGLAGEQEIDAGVLWEVIRLPDGKVSPVPLAYRPFWRNTEWKNSEAKPAYYYFPGDMIRMRCAVVGPSQLQLEIAVEKRGPNAAPALAALGFSPDAIATADTPTTLTVQFEAKGFGEGLPQQFKRVNGLDQSGNEGQAVKPTAARVEVARWERVVLLRGEERFPFTPERFTDMRCPDPQHVQAAPIAGDPTAEEVALRGQ